jgi:hypothetical protein
MSVKKKQPQPINTPAAEEPKRDNWFDDYTRKQNDLASQLAMDGNVRERARLAVCQNILRQYAGSPFTPFENFFEGLITHCEEGKWPSPDVVQGMVDEYREHLNDMTGYVRDFIENSGVDFSEAARKARSDAA